MKNKKTYIISCLLLLLFIVAGNKKIAAQNSKYEIVTGIGFGYSLAPMLVNMQAQQNWGNYNYKSYPPVLFTISSSGVLNATIDYGLCKVLSIGGGISYQYFTVNANAYTNSRADTFENVTENIGKLNVRMRLIAHWDFDNNHLWEFYGGVGIGASYWSDNNNSGDPNFPDDSPYETARVLSLQGLIGVRRYSRNTSKHPNNNIGIHLELAVGSPYFIDGGLNFRFGGLHLDKR